MAILREKQGEAFDIAVNTTITILANPNQT